MHEPTTLGELKRVSGARSVPVRDEMRQNHVRHDALRVLERTVPLAA